MQGTNVWQKTLTDSSVPFFHQPYRKGKDTWETEIVFFNNDQRANITTEEDDFRYVTWEGDPLLITDLIYD